METATQALGGLLTRLTDEIYVHVPCQVTAVHGNTVDAIAYINDDEDDFVLYNIPIKMPETQSAYIFLGIKKGDFGTLSFLDRDTSDYVEGFNTDYNGNDAQHDINSRYFELGFVPKPQAFVYPTDCDIEIGLKNNNAKIKIKSNGEINIIGNSCKINVPTTSIIGNVELTGNLTVNGNTSVTGSSNLMGACTFENKEWISHTHTGNMGNPTSGVN